MAGKRVTMHDVAARAGVSIKTVSRVVNEEPGVSASTVQTVKDVIDALGYQTDLQAQALRRGDRRSRTIGLLISSVANPFDGAMQQALEEVANLNKTAILALSSNNDPELERERIKIMLNRQVDALVVANIDLNLEWLEEQLAGRPVVFVDRQPEKLIGDAVVADSKTGALRATRHLLSHGHRKIAFFCDRLVIETARARRDGFFQAMAEAEVPVEDRLVRTDLATEEAARMATYELLSAPEPPTAIFAAQNDLTAGVLRALQSLQLDDRVAVVSFDDLPYAELFRVGLTAITQDPHAIGQIAAKRLFGRLSGEITEAPKKFVVPTGFVVRGSGEIRPPETQQS